MVCQQCFEDRSLYILSLRDSTTSLLTTSVLFTTCLPFSKPVRHHNQPLQGPPRFLCIILTPPTKHLCLEDEACQPINSSTAHTIYYKIIEFERQNFCDYFTFVAFMVVTITCTELYCYTDNWQKTFTDKQQNCKKLCPWNILRYMVFP